MINLFQAKVNQTKLTTQKLNQEVKRFLKEKANLESNRNQSWDNKVFVDLSNIEWVNTSTLVELILIIENLIENGIKVTVALPNRNMLSKYELHLKNSPEHEQIVKNRIEKRKEVRSWLYRLGIIKALLFEHQPVEIRSNIRVLDVFDKELFDKNPAEIESNYYKIHGPADVEQKGVGEKYHVPLLWTKGSNYHSDYVKNILKSSLDINHAQIISDIVIHELAKNVSDHSKKGHGLFCAVVKKHKAEKISKTDYYGSEILFFDECTEDEYVVEIVFGDSGKGIIETLSKNGQKKEGAELVRFAFDKWSTAKSYEDDEKSYLKRGTRGLYHVRRIMQNYEGMAAIRTLNHFTGFNDLINTIIDEEKNHPTFKGQKLPTFNGTLLTIKLLPGRAKTLGRYHPTSKSTEMNASDCEQLIINVNNIGESLKRVGEESKKNSTKNFLISLNFSELSDGKYGDKEKLNSNLRELIASLANLRHPNVHIVYGFPANFETSRIDNIVNEVKEYIIREKEKSKIPEQEQNKYLVFDPIMIIGPKGSLHWAGVQNPKLLLFLNKLMEAGDQGYPITSINIGEYKDLINYIKQDTGLFCKQNENIKLNFNKNAPIDYLKNVIQKRIEDLVNEYEQKKRVLITPNLNYAKGWLDINKIDKDKDLNNECAIALYSLWNSNRDKILRKFFPASFKDSNKQTLAINESHGETIIANGNTRETNRILDEIQRSNLKNNLKILVENEVDKPLGEKFLQFLDIEELHNNLKVLSDETDAKKPRRVPLFEKSDYVIIISSVVSTRETARNMVKAVLRSNAIPITLLSLADFSGEYNAEKQNYVSKVLDTDKDNVWGVKVLYFSFFPDNKLNVEKNEYDIIKCISPNDRKEENDDLDSKILFSVKDNLRGKILKSNSLHFSHIGKPNGRHFTFYFNAKRFLIDEYSQELWHEFKDVIEKWYKSININLGPDLTKEEKITIGKLTSVWYPDSEYKKGYQGQGVDLGTIIKNGFKREYQIDLPDAQATSREDTTTLYYEKIPYPYENKIIVDWGSITGESIEKLIHKTHKNGYKNILVCIFLNQLSDKKKAYLSSISTITSDFLLSKKAAEVKSQAFIQAEINFEINIPAQNKPEQEAPKTHPFISNVHIEFIHDFPLTCYESDYECNVCALREDLEKYEIPSSTLENYAKNRRKVLDIRPREFTKIKPLDFYSPTYEGKEKIELNQEFILRMFEFKTLLMNAQTRTYWRFRTKLELIGILKSLIDYKGNERINTSSETEDNIWKSIIKDSNDIIDKFKKMDPKRYNAIVYDDYNIDDVFSRTHAIIYFLSIETSWIQKSPLAINEIRQMLTLISKAIIFNNKLRILKSKKQDKIEKNIDVIRIKYATVTVLRMADKNEFVKNIANILENTQINDVRSDSIIENVLFHTNTFILKDYHALHEDLTELKPILNDVEDMFLAHPRYKKWRDSLWYLKIFVNNLKVRGNFRHYNSAEIVKSYLKSYKETFLHYRHSDVETKFNKLIFPQRLNDDELAKYSTIINEIHKNWEYVSDAVCNLHILTLKSIPKILASEWAIPIMYSLGLNNLNLDKKLGYDDEFSNLLKKIQEDRRILMNDQFMNNYQEQISMIKDYFICHPESNAEGRSAKVFDFINSMQSKYDEAYNRSIPYTLSEKLKGENKNIGLIVKVNNQIKNSPTLFYPQEELKFLLSHMIENCYKHRDRNINDVSVSISDYYENKYYIIKFTCIGTTTKIKGKDDLLKNKYQNGGLAKIIHNLESFEGDYDFKKLSNGCEFIFKTLCL